MAKYRVLEKSFIGNAIREAGDIVEYDGLVSGNLEPIDEEGREVAALSDEADAVSLENLAQAAKGVIAPTGTVKGKKKGSEDLV